MVLNWGIYSWYFKGWTSTMDSGFCKDWMVEWIQMYTVETALKDRLLVLSRSD